MLEAKLERQPQRNMSALMKTVWRYRFMYLLFIPAIIYFIVFAYIPFYGLTIAFKKYMAFKGIGASPWVGWDNFHYIFHRINF
jgi:putative aldouronate transport system permease protein